MELEFEGFLISDDKGLLQLERIYEMLHGTYWANERTRETIARAIENSLCFGVYSGSEQIGFARCVTDYATTFSLADVIIDERYRGRGIGKALIPFILSHDLLQGLIGSLATRDAHGLYAKYGFVPVDPKLYMRRPAAKPES
ncbi:MAG: GNAT family N-acetyltransferase [Eubacteriales bacterium]|nr:GNAT family N-acetyltransferase [Eubacteriales bacterium]